MFSGQYLLQSTLRSGFASLAANPASIMRVTDGLPADITAQATSWWTKFGANIPVLFGYPEKTPAGPMVAILAEAAPEIDIPIGMGGYENTKAGSEGRAYGTWFNASYRCVSLAAGSVEVALWVAQATAWILLSNRFVLDNPPYGYPMLEQTLELGQLGPMQEYQPTWVYGAYVLLRCRTMVEFDTVDTIVNKYVLNETITEVDIYGHVLTDIHDT